MNEEPTTVWNRPERGTRGPAPERSRGQITAAAVALADEGGLAAVSMRQVARRLGTGPASLYRYVSTRSDLLDLMADAVTEEIGPDVPLAGDPVEDLTALATRAKQVHLRHPWLLDLPTEPVPGPHGMDYLECALRALAPTGLSHPARLETIGLLNGLVSLFARTELRRNSAGAPPAALMGAAATRDRHPLVVAALASSPGPEAAADTHVLFDRMVRRVLTGLVRPDGGPGQSTS